MRSKSKLWIYPLIILGTLILVFNSCKKDDDPVPEPPTVTDIEGNVYSIVTIGDQTWMAENLRVTKYNDDTDIPQEQGTAWENLTTPAYCWYENKEDSIGDIYGALYNWFVVNTGKLCPEGWHVPTDDEWTQLIDFLGGEGVAGGMLKEEGTEHWFAPNTGATDEEGFSALPGGYRNYDGLYYSIGNNGNWWSSTEENAGNSWYRSMFADVDDVNRQNYLKQRGFSIRCVKD